MTKHDYKSVNIAIHRHVCEHRVVQISTFFDERSVITLRLRGCHTIAVGQGTGSKEPETENRKHEQKPKTQRRLQSQLFTNP